MKWDSPRGPMSIDPETRDVVQTIYIRKVEKVGGELHQRPVRQGRERQGPGQGADEVSGRSWRQAAWRVPTATAAAQGRTSHRRGRCDNLGEDSDRNSSTYSGMDSHATRMTGLPARRTLLAAASANAQGTVKVGVVMSYSGQFADPGAQIDNGIKLYMKQNGDTVAGKKIELIRKDTGGIAPDVAKRLSQEADRARRRRHPRRLRSHARTRSPPPTCRRRRRSSWST